MGNLEVKSAEYASENGSAYNNDYYGFLAGSEYILGLLCEHLMDHKKPFRSENCKIYDADNNEIFKNNNKDICDIICGFLNSPRQF